MSLTRPEACRARPSRCRSLGTSSRLPNRWISPCRTYSGAWKRLETGGKMRLRQNKALRRLSEVSAEGRLERPSIQQMDGVATGFVLHIDSNLASHGPRAH